MIYLFTDYGYQGPYVGELKAVLDSDNRAGQTVIDLMHDAPNYNPEASAYLLAALSKRFNAGDACLAVVDPGVGSEHRRPVLIVADEVVYCGPDNGLFSIVAQQTEVVTCYELTNGLETISKSFHGRDLFAPALIKYLNQDTDNFTKFDFMDLVGITWPTKINEIIYFDGYGNAIIGRRGLTVTRDNYISLDGIEVRYAETFSSVGKHEPFWYTNSMGLVEIAVNQSSAMTQLGLTIGQLVKFSG